MLEVADACLHHALMVSDDMTLWDAIYGLEHWPFPTAPCPAMRIARRGKGQWDGHERVRHQWGMVVSDGD